MKIYIKQIIVIAIGVILSGSVLLAGYALVKNVNQLSQQTVRNTTDIQNVVNYLNSQIKVESAK